MFGQYLAGFENLRAFFAGAQFFALNRHKNWSLNCGEQDICARIALCKICKNQNPAGLVSTLRQAQCRQAQRNARK
jgi:hypothetical protein